jgi:probable F420-dependent oxidoreductase
MRRYGSEFDPPGPRMRDYVSDVRDLFRAFDGTAPLDHHGPYYERTLLNPMWSPGPIGYPAPPIDVAAVGPYMLQMAGELCDGVHVHPLHSMKYLTDVVEPAIVAGAKRGGRERSTIELLVPVLTIVGDSEQERAASRAFCRQQVAFYGSTPNYALQFDLLGLEGTTARLRERQKAGDIAGMSAVISDDILQHYTVEARWDDLPDRLIARYRGRAGRLILYTAGMDYARDPKSLDRWGAVARAVSRASV